MTTSNPVAGPKLTPPRLHGIVERERLFRRIDSAGAPIVWIAGSPGAGKTALAASYLKARTLPTLWYQVDSGDADPATFFHFMRQAATRGVLRPGPALPTLPLASTGNLAAFAQHYFRALFARLAGRAVLVLDNFQDAIDTPFEVVARLAFEEAPDDRRVIVLCLTEPPSALARLVANRKIERVPAGELRFTSDESRQVVSGQLGLNDQASATLHHRSGGWAAGLVLMAEHARHFGASELGPLAASQEAVFDYFAGEILAQATPEHRRTLMLMAAVPRLTGELARVASADPGAERLLEYLYRRNLFIDRRDGPEVSYHYHALFRAFLQTRAAQLLAPAERAAAAVRAARVLEEGGYREEAATMYVAATDWSAATRVILGEAARLYEQGRSRTLLDWIAAIPAEVVAGNPWFAYWAGACQVWANPPVARRHLEQAVQGFAVAGDHNGQILAAGAISRACILDASWIPLDRTIAMLETLLDDDVDALPQATVLTGLSRLVYAAFARQPQHPRLPLWAQRAQSALDRAEDVNDAVMAAYSLMHYHHWTGSTAKQEEVVRRIDPLLPSSAISPISRCYWKWAHSNYLLRTGAPRAALAVINEGLELAMGNGLAIAAVLKRFRIGHYLTLGDLTCAESELTALESAPRVEPYYEMRAWLALQRADLPLARREAQTALQMADERGRTYYRALDRFLLAVILAEAGVHDDALAVIGVYREETAGVEGPLHEYHALLVEAYVALLRDDHEGCHPPMRRALEIGSRERYRSHWIWHPTMMARLYGEALEHRIAVGYVQDIIRTHALTPVRAEIEAWPWPVAFRTLGGFAVYLNGELLRFEGKTQRKPLELAKVLIAFGGRDVPEHRLIDILWPKPLEDGGKKALDITVHRLRRLLGSDEAVAVTDRHIGLDPGIVWVDVWALERRLTPLVADTNGVPPDVDLLADAVPHVLDLYRGEFLAGDAEAPWIIPVRNRVAGRFQRLVLRLGAHWEAEARWNRAYELYQRAIELDPLAETFYRRQMICLNAQGQRAEAIEVFRRCRQALSIVLGVPPTEETDAVYRASLSA